jgi:anthranilate synthase component 1
MQEQQLLSDEKQCAEHIMLVDLGRNDVGKVSKSGSVKVEKLMNIERYSHVMHISSTVRLFFFCITIVLVIYQILYFGNL